MKKENNDLRDQLSNALETHTSKSVGSLGSDLTKVRRESFCDIYYISL